MPISKEKEKFVRHAGNAMVAIFGVNDTTDFHDIHLIRDLIVDANESCSFMKMSKDNEHSNESEYLERMSNLWGSEFAQKYKNKKDQVKGAIWDLYILKKTVAKVEESLKFAINTYTDDTAPEFK